MVRELPWPPCGLMVTVPLVIWPPGVGCLPPVPTVRTGESETAKPLGLGVATMPGSWALTSPGAKPLLTSTWKVDRAVTEDGPLREIICRCRGVATGLDMDCQGKTV